MPKVHLRIKPILWTIFVLVVLAELLVLYKFLYLDSKKPSDIQVQAPSLRIDFEASGKAEQWFQDRANYVLPNYGLSSGTLGRENPLAEY